MGDGRGPICGETKQPTCPTPGPKGRNDRGDPDRPKALPRRRAPVDPVHASPKRERDPFERMGFALDVLQLADNIFTLAKGAGAQTGAPSTVFGFGFSAFVGMPLTWINTFMSLGRPYQAIAAEAEAEGLKEGYYQGFVSALMGYGEEYSLREYGSQRASRSGDVYAMHRRKTLDLGVQVAHREVAALTNKERWALWEDLTQQKIARIKRGDEPPWSLTMGDEAWVWVLDFSMTLGHKHMKLQGGPAKDAGHLGDALGHLIGFWGATERQLAELLGEKLDPALDTLKKFYMWREFVKEAHKGFQQGRELRKIMLIQQRPLEHIKMSLQSRLAPLFVSGAADPDVTTEERLSQ